MLREYCQKAFAVRRLNEVNHLVNDDIFQEILGLLHQLRIQTNMSGLLIATPPFGLHPVQERRVRHQRGVRGSAGESGRERDREDLRDPAYGGRAGHAEEERGLGA